MNQQSKKIFSVALALFLGMGIVFFAWRTNVSKSDKISFEPTASGDSWKDSLLIVPQASSTKTLGISNFRKSETSGEGTATTSTDVLARNLLIGYALTQKNMSTTTWSDSDALALAQSLVKDVEIPSGTQYTLKNLNTSADNSSVALTAYGKKVFALLKTSSSKSGGGEVSVFLTAVSANDSKRLAELASFVAEYATIKKSLLAVKTPSGVAPLHLRLVQNYANVESALIAMQKIFSDPVQGLAGFTEYQKEIAVLSAIGNDYKNYKPASQ